MLDLARNAARAPRGEQDRGGPGRASPIPHMRSSHFRNVRVGPRRDFHYEPRWIPPTWVRGDLDAVDQRIVVRHIPSPAAWGQRDLDNAGHRTNEVLRSPDTGVESRRQPDTVAVSPPDPTAPPRQPDDLFGPELA